MTTEEVAQKLLDATVTVRIYTPPVLKQQPVAGKKSDAKSSDEKAGEKKARASGSQAVVQASRALVHAGEVTVCSGVSAGDGLIVTFAHLPSMKSRLATDFKYRVTLPGGQQAVADARVIDFYSGLVLLKLTDRKLPQLPLAETLPKIGSVALTAAASGIQQPLVSKGVLSGVDRTIRDTHLPPMIQCDISTTETSSGAGVVDADARLIGVLAGISTPGQRFGWSYALPVRYVRRVLDAYQENRLVVLVRQRPKLGVCLKNGEEKGTVVLDQIAPGEPADKAGLRQGDQIAIFDGTRVRSPFQVMVLLMKHQPGDELPITVRRGEEELSVSVTLGDGGVFANLPSGGQKVVQMRRLTSGAVFGVQKKIQNVQALKRVKGGTMPSKEMTKAEQLEQQWHKNGQVIQLLQQTLRHRENLQRSLAEQLEAAKAKKKLPKKAPSKEPTGKEPAAAEH